MVIPKQFEGIEDLEAMLLTSVLGTLIALKENLISYKQAESYWFSDFTADLFEDLKLSDDIVNLLKECCQLKDLMDYTQVYEDKLDTLILSAKQLIGKYYTEYEGADGDTVIIQNPFLN